MYSFYGLYSTIINPLVFQIQPEHLIVEQINHRYQFVHRVRMYNINSLHIYFLPIPYECYIKNVCTFLIKAHFIFKCG